MQFIQWVMACVNSVKFFIQLMVKTVESLKEEKG